MNDKVRIRDKEHLEQIFRKFAELYKIKLDDCFILECFTDLTFGHLKETCECIGYENLLLDGNFVDDIEQGNLTVLDTFYIDLVGIKDVDCGNMREFSFFGGRKLIIDICHDGTLKIRFKRERSVFD